MKKENQNLWLKVARFPLNDPNAAYPFSAKLASNQGWSEDKTWRVIAEYKKFMFLCMTAPNGASPSSDVDECWHLHLTFTANYAAFCAETSGKFIHHNPSKGGTTEHHRHIDWYDETLKNYVQTFQQIPPSDIWAMPFNFKATDYLTSASPMHPLSIEPFSAPDWRDLKDESVEHYACVTILLGILTTIPFVGNPFALSGQSFLWYYGILTFALIIFKVNFKSIFDNRVKERLQTLYKSGLSIYQTAFWVGGENRVIQTAALELIEQGMLKKLEEPSVNKTLLLDTSADFDETLLHNPFYLTLQTVEKQQITPTFLTLCAAPTTEVLQHDAERLDIMAFPTIINSVLTYLFLALGIGRFFQGISNHKPIGFLVVLVVIGFVTHLIWQFNRKSIQALIESVFRQNRAETLVLNYATKGRDALANASFTDIALALALIATDWGLPNKDLGQEGGNSFVCGGAVAMSSDGGDGGDGGGCSGGDGGGGGCGGGCGGCGGCGS
jgi:uncharacterized protein (TIGR04222 family)